MRHLVYIGTGGTIATRGSDQGRRVEVAPGELLAAARAVWPDPGVDVEVRGVRQVVSFAATTADALDLVRAVREAAARADGVVVTHGTDTMEEVAFLVALAHGDDPVPVVFTGAQRPFDAPGGDGARNLATALRWAAAPQARGTGVSIAFNDEIWPAVGVRKTHSLALSAFAATGRGPIARIDDAGLRRHHRPPLAPALPGLAGLDDLPRVDVVPQYLGVDARALRAAVDAGARGIAVAAFGAGNTAPGVTRAVADVLGEGVPVAIASRTFEGPVVGLYAGGGTDLAAAGAIFAGDLSPWQARLLLAAVLAGSPEPPGPERLDRIRERCTAFLRAVGAAAEG
ncbi:asparaginase [Nocardiopsis sediminis]|uniref:Asparaginase n=1 Tax=Nocardiopsis sediminis TaxID=1778267 RepID=A0ABV8FS48_9ACTN